MAKTKRGKPKIFKSTKSGRKPITFLPLGDKKKDEKKDSEKVSQDPGKKKEPEDTKTQKRQCAPVMSSFMKRFVQGKISKKSKPKLPKIKSKKDSAPPIIAESSETEAASPPVIFTVEATEEEIVSDSQDSSASVSEMTCDVTATSSKKLKKKPKVRYDHRKIANKNSDQKKEDYTPANKNSDQKKEDYTTEKSDRQKRDVDSRKSDQKKYGAVTKKGGEKKNVIEEQKMEIDDVVAVKSAPGKEDIVAVKSDMKLDDIPHKTSDVQDRNVVSEKIDETRVQENNEVAERSKEKDDDIQKPSYKLIPSPTCADEIILLLEVGGELPLAGTFSIKSIYGKGTIFGYTIKPGQDWQNVYNLNHSLHFPIVAEAASPHSMAAKNYFKKNQLDYESDFKRATTCVFVLRELDNVVCNSFRRQPQFQLPFEQVKFDKQNCLSWLGLRYSESVMERPVIKPSALTVRDTVLAALKNNTQTRAPSIVICGLQNAGKSTFCRYLINSIIGSDTPVAFIDCDVGQTEVTPPGCVSLSILKTPLLGPPFTHLQSNSSESGPAVQYFIGHVTPGDDPSFYISCLEQTILHYLDHYSHLPLVVNTMGWLVGIGLSLLVETIRMIQPTYVVELGKSGIRLTPEAIQRSSRWERENPRLAYQESNHELLHVGNDRHSRFAKSDLKPRDRRNMALLAYFLGRGSSLSPYSDLHGMEPYKIKWNQVAIHTMHYVVPFKQIMYAINCSVVGLCVVPDEDLVKSAVAAERHFPMRLRSKPFVPCRYFGIVRGVDPVEETFLIVTPASFAQMQTINCLLVGAVNLPEVCFFPEKPLPDTVPYIDRHIFVAGVLDNRTERANKTKPEPVTQTVEETKKPGIGDLEVKIPRNRKKKKRADASEFQASGDNVSDTVQSVSSVQATEPRETTKSTKKKSDGVGVKKKQKKQEASKAKIERIDGSATKSDSVGEPKGRIKRRKFDKAVGQTDEKMTSDDCFEVQSTTNVSDSVELIKGRKPIRFIDLTDTETKSDKLKEKGEKRKSQESDDVQIIGEHTSKKRKSDEVKKTETSEARKSTRIRKSVVVID